MRPALLLATVSTALALAVTATPGEEEPVHEAAASAVGGADPEAGTLLADFSAAHAGDAWRVVNDDVMGGRSLGDAAYEPAAAGEPGKMVFFGSINTNGGGFASVRRSIETGVLADASGIAMRVKTDGRPYDLSLQDGSAGRRGRLNHRARLPVADTTDWQTVVVSFDSLAPTFHGDPVEGEPFDPAGADDLRLILSDVVDGPFRMEVAWIRTIPAAE